MKQFRTILSFELSGYLKNKVFVGVTLFLVAVLAAVMFFPRVTESMSERNAEEDADAAAGRQVLLLYTEDEETEMLIYDIFASSFPGYNVRLWKGTLDGLKAEITGGRAECAFALDSISSYTYYVNNLTMYDANTSAADEALQTVCRMSALMSAGLTRSEAEAVFSVNVESRVETLGVDQAQNFFYTYIMIFALYMVILLYGQMVATNVATEKSSRAMELLITSARPVSMMFGKVIASCLAGLMQLLAVFGSAFLFFNMNRSYWDADGIVASIFDMPLGLLAYMMLFFVLGFFIYAFLYGAIGSTASKLEDINTSVMPVTVLFVAGFMVVILSMTDGSVDSVAMRICSFVPFTSPMAMFTRIAMSTVPAPQIVISVALLAASVVGVGVISAKIYKVGVLLYGTTPKPGEILKALRRA